MSCYIAGFIFDVVSCLVFAGIVTNIFLGLRLLFVERKYGYIMNNINCVTWIVLVIGTLIIVGGSGTKYIIGIIGMFVTCMVSSYLTHKLNKY